MKRALLFAIVVAGCGNARPIDSLCAPGFQRCDVGVLEQCADDGGSWRTLDDCGQRGLVCDLNRGCVACEANIRTCTGQDVVRCRPDGSGFDAIATCDATTGQVCAGGDCKDACALAAEQHSYEGCEYWAADLDNAVVADQGAAAAQQYAVVLSNPSQLDAFVTVDILCDAADAASPAIGCTAGQVFTVAGPLRVGPGTLRIIDLDPREVDGSSRPELNDGSGTARSMHAYRIHATAPIIAYQFNPLENAGVFSNDASLLLPTESLDGRYMVMSWPQTLALTSDSATNGGINLRAFLTIIGVTDQTTVDIKLSTDIIGGGGVPPSLAGDTVHVVLDRYEVLNLETGSFNADFTGTSITTDAKPIAVFTGSEASDVPRFDTIANRRCCADHLEEQLFPEVAFGQGFIAVKTPIRSAAVAAAGWPVTALTAEPEYWRIVASHDGTLIHTNLPIPNDVITLDRGQSTIIESSTDFTMEASMPVAVGQYPASQQATGIPSTLPDGSRPPGGDPSSILVPPVEQWRDHYLILVPDKYAFDSLLIAAPSTARLRIDNMPIESFDCDYHPAGTLPIGPDGTDLQYVAIRCMLSKPSHTGVGMQNDGVHYLDTTSGDHFGLIVWGWDSFVSYGYPGGSNISPINLQ
jgi:hypothetical protein